jgi:hypothetical protein
MTHGAPVRTKIPTKIPQPTQAGAVARPCPAEGPPLGTQPGPHERNRTPGHPRRRQPGNRAEDGITVCPAREGQDRWRAVWHENGKRRQCEAVSQERLAATLEKVTERLAADAPDMERPAPT